VAEAPFHRVILWSRRSKDLFSELRAGFDAEGHLHVDGQDIGSFVEDSMGRDEYEYFIIVQQPQVAGLAAALAQALGDPAPAGDAVLPFVTAALKKIYDEPPTALHFTTSTDLREWLKQNDIKSEFDTW
jgi:hypothetical protein